MGGLSGVVCVENVRSVLSFLKVGNHEERWDKGTTREDESLGNIRDCIDRNRAAECFLDEAQWVREFFQLQSKKSSRRSLVLTGDDNCAAARTINDLDASADAIACQGMTFPKR